MKKTRKVLLTVLSVLTVAAVSLGAASCELLEEYLPSIIGPSSSSTSSSSSSPTEDSSSGSSSSEDSSSESSSSEDSSSESSSSEDSSTENSSSEHTEHTWVENYQYDDWYHWLECGNCHEFKDKTEHTPDEFGICIICGQRAATKDVLYQISADGTYAGVIGYKGTAKRVKIADTYNGLPVKTIYNKAFYDNDKITSVTIPDSVTSIGHWVFQYCSSLTSVYITDIAAWCNISFGNYDANPLCHGANLYLNNELVTELVIPDGVTSIGSYAFRYCSSLTSVEIPDSVTSIGYDAFDGCSSLIFNEYENCNYLGNEKNPYFALIKVINTTYSSYTIHENTKVIAGGAFYKCSSWTSVAIPDSVTSIGEHAFRYCSSLTSVYITDIEAWCNISFGSDDANPLCNGANLYLNNELVTELVIPNTITEIKQYAFYGCSSLTSIVIPDSVTSIGYDAFLFCYKLVEVVNKSTHITVKKGSSPNGAVGCYALAVYNSGDSFESKLSYDNEYIIYTDGEEKILVGYTGTETDLVLPSYVTKINTNAFNTCYRLTSVVIPDSVTSIGEYAFAGCSSLTSVVIPDSVTSIGNYAFYWCRNLTSVVIGDSVTSIGNSAFAYCSSLTSVVIPDSVTSISSYAFDYCSSLTSVVIGNSVTSIGYSAFGLCSSLTSVVIGDSVTSIGNCAFENCYSLTSVVIPDSVTSIGYNAFFRCSSLSVYYKGTASEWSAISIHLEGNSSLTSATRYYYRETKPTSSGNYWHYVDGIPTKW